jgi:hypothetical protein
MGPVNIDVNICYSVYPQLQKSAKVDGTCKHWCEYLP